MKGTFWLLIGFLSQACFFMRFFIQWLVSERKKRSVIPASFWYLSICGAVGLFFYALHRMDPVFIVGQGLGIFIYSRNIMLRGSEGA